MEMNKDSSPLLDGHIYAPIKRCPKCESVFVTANECEGCGYQLSFEKTEDGLSEKGFYNIKDTYWLKQSVFVRYWPILENKVGKKAQKYCRFLNKRSTDLMEFLSEQEKNNQETKVIYWIELRDLMVEASEYPPFDKKSLMSMKDFIRNKAPLYSKKFLRVDESKNYRTRWEQFLNFYIFGILRVKFAFILAISIMAFAIVIQLGYHSVVLFN